MSAVAAPAPADVLSPETISATISYADGSIATVIYNGLGGASMPKERIEVFRAGRSWVLDDFRRLTTHLGKDRVVHEPRRVEKGHAELLRSVLSACRGRAEFVPGIDAAYSAQAVALASLESIATGEPVVF